MATTPDVLKFPVEEHYKNSSTDTLRSMALRIFVLKEDTEIRVLAATAKFLIFTPLMGFSGYFFFRNLMEGNGGGAVIAGIALFGSGFTVSGGIQDINQVSLNEREIGALTTVLASELIAESKQNQPNS